MNTAAAFADFRTYPLISALTAVHTWRTAFKCSDTFMTDSQAKKRFFTESRETQKQERRFD